MIIKHSFFVIPIILNGDRMILTNKHEGKAMQQIQYNCDVYIYISILILE